MDQNIADQPNVSRRGYIPARCVSFIEKLRHNTNRENGNKPHNETELARQTRHLGYATWVIAGVGVLSFCAALLQWDALRSTDDTTKKALIDVQRAFVTSYEIKIAPDNPSTPTSWSVSPILENGGNTSATQLRVRILRFYASPIWQMRRVHIKPGATNPDINEVAFDAMPEASITLAPHAKISLATYVLTAQGLGIAGF